VRGDTRRAARGVDVTGPSVDKGARGNKAESEDTSAFDA
jgi:hypothetical protein